MGNFPQNIWERNKKKNKKIFLNKKKKILFRERLREGANEIKSLKQVRRIVRCIYKLKNIYNSLFIYALIYITYNDLKHISLSTHVR